jgi:hypothetical protein
MGHHFSISAFLKSAETLRGLLITRRYFLPEIAEALPYHGIGECLQNGGVQFAENICWCAFGCPHSVPDRNVKALQSSLVHGRKIGSYCSACFRGDSVGFNFSRAGLWHRIGDLIEHQVNLAGYQILQRRACPRYGTN